MLEITPARFPIHLIRARLHVCQAEVCCCLAMSPSEARLQTSQTREQLGPSSGVGMHLSEVDSRL
jgi:hypothetical protein